MKCLQFIVLLVVVLNVISFAQGNEPIIIQRISGEVTIDGLINEQAWEGITSFNPVMHRPAFGEPASEKTDILLAYDDNYLYLAGKLFDSVPDKIQSTTYKRDAGAASSEWFGLALDTYNDKENALAFFTTPSGLRWDAAIINDSQGGINVETTWNTFWDVEVSQNREGWFAEFRIPFSSLRFQEINGKVVMGLISWRLIPRKSEWDIFPAIPPNWGGRSFYKISEAREIVFEGIKSRSPVYISPYVFGGFEENNFLNEEGSEYNKQNKRKLEAGLDLKYPLTSNLTLDVTLNTDFAQVEADDQQINLTRFSLFFPEKRVFFQERSSIFEFEFESTDQNRLFYSRRIGIHNGQPVRIYGGVKLAGRVGDWDIGLLNMQTAPVDEISSVNYGVMRLKKQVINPFSYIGLMTTSKISTEGKYNLAYGLDGVFNLFDNDYLALKWAQSFDKGEENNPLSFDQSRIRILLQRRNNKGFGYGLAYSYGGKNYNPELGFETRKDFTRYSVGAWYGWFPGNDSWLFKHQPYISSKLFQKNENGQVESASIDFGWDLETKSGYLFGLNHSILFENVSEEFSIFNEAGIPDGEYHFNETGLYFDTPSGESAKLHIGFSTGSFYDGNKVSFDLSPRWNVSTSLELSGSYELNCLDFPERNQSFTGHIGKLKLLYMMNTKLSLAAFIQYSNIERLTVSNIRFRYNPVEGDDLYIVFNHGLNLEREKQFSIPPVTNSWNISIKYIRTFTM